ncbi:DUF3306 domain-containing protein [Azospirillum soli]|uniref:DUF3306 domain-containing protein n=1 Tax=Azospirillum soli TaxID=1304799 RepID=UPI001AE4F397|nr:DUF3306 domain-containing protein [Azospirillum soli]MBP2313186.1 hypothetical protein [Azospirillum soli]
MTDEPFLSRWSRLKRRAAEPVPEPTPEPVVEEAPAEAPLPVPEEPAPAAEAEDPLKDLPPVEELTVESDFTPFLRAEVPEDLHRQALRKLWTSDPVFANDDGLKDYADDYTGLFNLPEPVKTLYRVGKGFLDAAEEAAERAEAAGVAASENSNSGEKSAPDDKEADKDSDVPKTT